MTKFLASRYSGGSALRNYIVGALALISAGLLIWTLYFLLTTDPTKATEAKKDAYPFLVLWGAGPPIWFWCEYHLIWLTAGDQERGDFDEFKHSQEMSRNIWLALLGIIAGLYFRL